MFDLTQAMTDAAERATATREPLPAATLLPRIRRRRLAVRGGQSALGVITVGALALAASQFGGATGDGLPPAGSSLPNPSGHTAGWPEAVSIAGLPACGEPLPELTLRDDALQTSVTADMSTHRASGTTVPIVSALSFGGLDDGTSLYATQPRTPVVVLLDGTGRVAAMGGGLASSGTIGGSQGASVSSPTLVPLVACDGSGPLTPGQYSAYGLWPLSAVDPADVPAGSHATFTGDDSLLVVAGSGAVIDISEPVGEFAAPIPGCGESTGGLATAADLPPIGAKASIDIGTIVAGDLVHSATPDVIEVHLTVTNDDAALDLGVRQERLAWVLADSDGKVLASGDTTVQQDQPGQWDTGQDRAVTLVDDLIPCGSGAPIGPGTYQVWVLADLPADLSPSVPGLEPLGVVVGPITLVLAS